MLHIDELLQHNGDYFVSLCYTELLGRAPDPAGFSRYTGLIASGISRRLIVAEISHSREARRHGATIKGLTGARILRTLLRLPVTGHLLRLIKAHQEPAKPLLVQLRLLESRIIELVEALQEQNALLDLKKEHGRNSRRLLPRANTAAIDHDAVGLSPRAMMIFRELKLHQRLD